MLLGFVCDVFQFVFKVVGMNLINFYVLKALNHYTLTTPVPV